MNAASQVTSSKNPIWWGLTIAIVAIAGAASYRLVVDDGAFSFSGGADGFKLISEAKDNLNTATSELTDLKEQLQAKEAALKVRESELGARQAEIERLLALLDKLATSAPASPNLVAARAQLDRLKATPASRPTPTVDWAKFAAATGRLDSAHSALAKLPRQQK